MRRANKLPRSFYNRPTLTVAEELLGKHLVYVHRGVRLSGKIVEVEAYIGEDDPACHAAPGPTSRNAVMYGPPGYSYVYFIYGMYHCLNIVTERKGFPAAVLFRALEPLEGVEKMIGQSPRAPHHLLLSGPGRLCRSLGLTTAHSGLDMLGDRLFVEDIRESVGRVTRTPRVGIRKGGDRLWRFVDASSAVVSGPGRRGARIPSQK
jgi:DNA-3-methyladenine glycosylase